MSATTTPFPSWRVDYHKTMAATASVGAAIKSGSSILLVAKYFWSLDRKLKNLLSDLEQIRNLPPDELRNLASKLDELNTTLTPVLELAGNSGLANRTLVSPSIQSLRVRTEDLQDVLERFLLSLDPSLPGAVQDAMEEYRRGETVPLETLLQ